MNRSSAVVRKLTLFAVLVCLAAALLYFLASGRRASEPGFYQAFPEFSLTDQEGRSVAKSDLAGKVWIADFIFTRCSGICPVMTSRMYGLQDRLKEVRLVSFTSDPAFDTPEILKGYSEIAGAEPGRWSFLTGPKEHLEAVSVGLKFGTLDDPGVHSGYFVLVDAQGAVRGFYDSADAERLSQLEQDAKRLTGVR